MIQCLTLQSFSAYSGGAGDMLGTPVLSAVSRLCMNQMGRSGAARSCSFFQVVALFSPYFKMEHGRRCRFIYRILCCQPFEVLFLPF